MAGFVAGDVVVVPFPFTDLRSLKRRPALVLAAFTRGDVLLCQITSQAGTHPDAIAIERESFQPDGALSRLSFVLPHRLVTAHGSLVLRRVGALTADAFGRIVNQVCDTIRRGG